MWAPPDLSPGIGSLRPEGGHEPRLPAPSQLSLQGPRCQSGSHSSGGSFQKPFSILFRFHFWAPGCWMALALEVETDLPPWGDQVGHGVSRKVSQHPSCDSLHLSVSFHGNKILFKLLSISLFKIYFILIMCMCVWGWCSAQVCMYICVNTSAYEGQRHQVPSQLPPTPTPSQTHPPRARVTAVD